MLSFKSAALARRLATGASRLSTAAATPKKNLTFGQGLAGGLVLAGLHSATGSSSHMYEYRFPVQKDADDLASFYGGEELMELFCVFPFVGQIMMRSGYFDEKGNVITQGIPGTMKVSMVFSDEVDDDTGVTVFFNKRERFHNTLFGYTMWDMVGNFGFQTLEDGTIECYHYGEYFHGNLPIVSQAMLLLFKAHARWLAWSTEHHLNHYAFTANTDEEMEREEESRKNMPVFLLKKFLLVDLKALVFGAQTESDDDSNRSEESFLVRRGTDVGEDRLPVQMKERKIQISQDIASDRAAVKSTLARAATNSVEDVKVVLARTYSTNKSSTSANAYSVATEAARTHHLARRATELESDIGQFARHKTTVKGSQVEARTQEGNNSSLERRQSSMGA